MNKYSIIDKYAYQFDIQRRLNHANNRVCRKPLIKLTAKEKAAFGKKWGGV